jgi:two-component system, NarL family, nitrate/nitrite response regulator NarL
MASVIGLGLIDDDQMLLDGMAAWLRQLPDLRVLRTARTVSDFLRDRPGASPGPLVVLLSLNLSDRSVPADNVARLRAHGHRVLVVTTTADPAQVLATIDAGAAGHITRDHDLAALAHAARQVAGGAPRIAPEMPLPTWGQQPACRPQRGLPRREPDVARDPRRSERATVTRGRA